MERHGAANGHAADLAEEATTIGELSAKAAKRRSWLKYHRQQVLLGPLGLQVIGACVRWTSAFGCSPFIWDGEKEEIVISNSKLRYLSWIISATVIGSYNAYLVMRLMQSDKNSGTSDSLDLEQVLMYFWICLLSMATVMQIALFKHYQELPPMFRRVKTWLREVSEHYLSHPDPKVQGELRSKMDVMMLVAVGYDVPSVFIWIVPSVLFPESKLYVTSILAGAENLGVSGRILGTVLYAYIVNSTYSTVYLWTMTFFPVGFNLPTVLKIARKELELDIIGNNAVNRHQQSHMIAAHHYRHAQLLTTELNQVYCSTVVPALKWVCLIMSAYCFCGFFLTRGVMRWLMLSCFLVTLSIIMGIFNYFGKFYTRSLSFIAYCHGNWTTKLDRKVLRHLLPLRVSMGGIYFVDEVAPLTIFQFTLNVSIWLVFTKHG